MIGSGVFIVSALMSRQLGSSGYLMLAWVISALITLIAALSYGELAGMMPKAGGQYVYLKEAYNPLVGFLFGWTSFMVNQTGTIAALGVAFAKFASVFIPAFSTANILLDMGFLKISAAQVLAISIIIIITLINMRGIEIGKLIQGIFTSTKILALAVLVIAGIIVSMNGHFISDNFHNMWNASSTEISKSGVITQTPLFGFSIVTALGVAMVGSLFSSDAWNNITFISSEVKNPGRNIPLSLLFGTLIVSVLYILANLAYLAILPLYGSPSGADVIHQGIAFAKDDRVGTAAVSVMLGNGAAYIMAALIMVSTFGCNNGIILSGARLYYAMAKDGLFFKQGMQLNKNGVPAKSLIFQCIWACILCLMGSYSRLLDYIIIASLLFYIFTIIGIFILRKKQPNAERPYKVIAYPFLPILYIIIAAAISIDLLVKTPEDTLPGMAIILLGIPFYYVLRRTSTKGVPPEKAS
jgi:APA family basic amino acid/polyamine antiporter